MRIIVTGADGFVGKYLVDLLKKDPSNDVIGLDRTQADITDFNQVNEFIKKENPDQVYHLAGFASGAGKDEDLITKVNVEGTKNILEALKALNKPVRILLASTGYVYGNTTTCATEDSNIDAKSFYDRSKIQMEEMSKEYLSDNLQIVITRASNHTGPGQRPGFVVPDFCEQIAKGADNGEIAVGNLEAKRDLFDVRDCVKAYEIVMSKGTSGEVYNVGTGCAISIREVLDKIIQISGKKITTKDNPDKMRPSDIPQNCVDSLKVQALGWKPEIKLDRTLEETYKSFLG